MADARGKLLIDSVRFELQIPIPQKRHDDGNIDGDACVYFPADAENWKQELIKHLKGNSEMFLTLTDAYGGDFALVFSAFPDKDVGDRLEQGTVFGFTMQRHTLEALGRAIQFALQENAVWQKPK